MNHHGEIKIRVRLYVKKFYFGALTVWAYTMWGLDVLRNLCLGVLAFTLYPVYILIKRVQVLFRVRKLFFQKSKLVPKEFKMQLEYSAATMLDDELFKKSNWM